MDTDGDKAKRHELHELTRSGKTAKSAQNTESRAQRKEQHGDGKKMKGHGDLTGGKLREQ
jgi:hypothetical protein